MDSETARRSSTAQGGDKSVYIKPKTEQDDIIKKHEADKEKLRKKKQSQENKVTNAKQQQNRRT